MNTGQKNGLLPQHHDLLRASAIAPEVVTARGYRSIETKAELERLGFSRAQRRVPALLLPVWGVTGEIVLYQARPDMPRINRKGKAVRYETPRGANMALDVHPHTRSWLVDPNHPLFLIEGIRKADSAVSQGLCCIAVLGVWNWRGTNGQGGKTALPDWESIALNGRPVYICFDSDVMLKPEVHKAMARLSSFLELPGAMVAFIYLPVGDGGAKVGLDDYLAEGHTVDDLLALASSELRRPDGETGPTEAQSLADLRMEVDNLLNGNDEVNKVPYRERMQTVADLISGYFVRNNRLLLDTSSEPPAPYILADGGAALSVEKGLLPLAAELNRAGLNGTEQPYSWVIADLQARAFHKGRRVSLTPRWSVWKNGVLYVSCGPRHMVRVAPRASPEIVPNGTDDVLFAGDAVLPEWEPAEPIPPLALQAFWGPALMHHRKSRLTMPLPRKTYSPYGSWRSWGCVRCPSLPASAASVPARARWGRPSSPCCWVSRAMSAQHPVSRETCMRWGGGG